MNKSPFETTKRWYETSKNDKNYSESSRRRDEERKDKEDPMNLFKRR